MKQQYIYGLHAVTAALQAAPQNIINILVQQGKREQSLYDILTLAEAHNIAVRVITKHELDKILPGCCHQGIVAIATTTMTYKEKDLPHLLTNLAKPAFLLILDGVQDPHNLGACLRSANAAGVHAVIAPKDNAVGITPVVRKVASGAAETTPFVQVTNLVRTMQMLQKQGIWLYGATSEAGDSIYQADLVGPIALVLGGEGKGLRRLTKEHCDVLLNIPMLGTVSSLNVAVAAGICLFEVVRQRTTTK
jgi:23S rRNA (guanosine2251-2'-O)-methyltransferase